MKHIAKPATILTGALLAACVLLGVAASTQAQQKAAPAAAPAATTLKGEIVDSGCFLGHGARGAKHKSCAVKCAKSGMPLALVTDDGAVYLLVPHHDNMEPFKQSAGLVAAVVEVSGKVLDKGGMKAIEMHSIKKVEDAK
jgi:hypothetical protein